MDGTSRVTGDCHARFCERLGVKFPGPTRRRWATGVPTATRLFFAEVVRSQDGIAELRVGGVVVQVAGPEAIPKGQGYLCIRAEDVVLAQHQETHASVRNQLRGTVASVTAEGALVRVSVDCGFPLTALITKQACEELRLSPGQKVVAAVKATALHFIPRG